MTQFLFSCLGAITLTSLAACAPSQPAQIPSPAPVTIASPVAVSPVASPAAVRKSNSDIGKTDQNGTVINIDTPSDPVCHRKAQSIKKDTFDRCLVMGMTYVQAANALGYVGDLQAQSGTTEVWQWNDGSGRYATLTFTDGYLVSKSQIGLQSDF